MAAAKDRNREKTLLYVPGDGWLHRLNPLTKLTGLGLVAVAAFTLPPAVTIVIAVTATMMGTIAGAGPVFLRRLTLTLAPLALALFVVHGMLMDHPNRFDLFGIDLSRDGLFYMVKILGRIAALLAGSLVFVTTTHPSALLKSLDSHGFPPGVSYLVASPLLLLEPFTQRARAIREAQMARGLDLEGSFLARIRAFPALLLPLVTLALADIDHRAQVLDGRGFRSHPRRTVLDAPPDSPAQRLARRAMLALAPFLIVGAFFWH